MFKLCSHIQIRNFAFKGGINEVKIRRSVHEFIDTATIKLPALSKVWHVLKASQDIIVPGDISVEEVPSETVGSAIETAIFFKPGDKVIIKLGYNNDLNIEFVGFIKKTILSTPAVIECVGFAWQLRNTVNASWKITSLRSVLSKLTEGTDIKLSASIPDVQLTNYSTKNKSGVEVLSMLKETIKGLTIFFSHDVLYAGLQQGFIKKTVQLRLGWNVARDNKLTSEVKENIKLLVRYISKLKTGDKFIYEVGEKGGNLIEVTLPYIKDQEFIKALANEKFSQSNNPGIGGELTCFLQPFCEPSWAAKIIDKKYNARDGLYFISSTEVQFGMKGARRIINLTGKLS